MLEHWLCAVQALLAAAKTAQIVRDAEPFGLDTTLKIHFNRVHAHVQSVIDSVAPHDSVERFNRLGVEVIRGEARFLDNRTIAVDGRTSAQNAWSSQRAQNLRFRRLPA